jgi:hypothetical protein
MLAGGAIFPLEMFLVAVLGWDQFVGRRAGMGVIGIAGLGGLVCCIVNGAILGYLAGCIMASVFLAQEMFRRRSRAPASIELLPFTAADFDTLISWVQLPQFFDLWSQGQFRYPLDHDQLAAHLDSTAGHAPHRLCFKAVCGEMEEMVAYVELASINRKRQRAAVELPIVDPSRHDRGDLSDALVWEIMQEAFDFQCLQWLDVLLHRSEAEATECFRKHGFFEGRHRTAREKPQEYRLLVRNNRY